MDDARSGAAHYEATLEASRRKRLGQFFTGLPLGRLLASVALNRDASTVIDPMAGHGDLLDAVVELAVRRDQTLRMIHGVEIDLPTAEMCRRRMATWHGVVSDNSLSIRIGDAFDVDGAHHYAAEGYDLVITNPPYVRYQTLSTSHPDIALRPPAQTRQDLRTIVCGRVEGSERLIWKALIESYSGLADLSVPAWILAASLVRPGGVLAIVAPATWRSRDYGDIIEYLLARCFRLEHLVEDTQPGWFSDALVRTQLVIARRCASVEARIPLLTRAPESRLLTSARISPRAGTRDSLVGAAFPSIDPEDSFSEWLHQLVVSADDHQRGLAGQVNSLTDITDAVLGHLHRRKWFRDLEPSAQEGSLFQRNDRSLASILPHNLTPLLDGLPRIDLLMPGEAGLSISQGLRTGCNGFFYVELVKDLPGGSSRIRLSEMFGREETHVPSECLVPVVRRQAEVSGPVRKTALAGRALDLTNWVLPEEAKTVASAKHLYAREGRPIPRTMPKQLADLVRRAANTAYRSDGDAKSISELSAVKTNTRNPRGGRTPRFWYMLPPFTRRHRPDAFVARINQGIPWVEVNDDEPVLVDANFSSIWSQSPSWTRLALRALLNSSWCRACMESLGTPLGGGALKLEATHLRRLPLPPLSEADLIWLDTEGRSLTLNKPSAVVDTWLLERITHLDPSSARLTTLVSSLRIIANDLCRMRQKQR